MWSDARVSSLAGAENPRAMKPADGYKVRDEPGEPGKLPLKATGSHGGPSFTWMPSPQNSCKIICLFLPGHRKKL